MVRKIPTRSPALFVFLLTTLLSSTVATAAPIGQTRVARSSIENMTMDQYRAESDRGRMMLDSGKRGEAEQIYLRLVQSPYAKKDPMIHCRLADVYLVEVMAANPRLGDAEKELLQALAIDPEFGPAYRNMAQVAFRREDLPQVIKWANKAVTCKKPDRSALYNRARAYAALKRPQLALADLDALLKEQKGNLDMLRLKAQLLEQTKRYDEAIAVYRQEGLHKDWGVLQIVRCLKAEKKYDEAIKECTALIDKAHDDDYYRQRATVYVLKNDWKSALADYTAAIKIDPLSRYYKERAAVYEKLGQNDLAKKDLEAAKAKDAAPL